MYNVEIRNILKRSGIFNYQLASAMGIPETSLSRIMARRELTDDEKAVMKSRIAEIIERRKELMP